MNQSDKLYAFRNLQARGELVLYKSLVKILSHYDSPHRSLILRQLNENKTQSLSSVLQWFIPHKIYTGLQSFHQKMNSATTTTSNAVKDALVIIQQMKQTVPKAELLFDFLGIATDTKKMLGLIADFLTLILSVYYRVPLSIIVLVCSKLALTLSNNAIVCAMLGKFGTWVSETYNKVFRIQGEPPAPNTGRFTAIKIFVKGLFGMQPLDDKSYTHVLNKMRCEISLFKDFSTILACVTSIFKSILKWCCPHMFQPGALETKIVEWETLNSKLLMADLVAGLGVNATLATELRKAHHDIKLGLTGPLSLLKTSDPTLYDRYFKVASDLSTKYSYILPIEGAANGRCQPLTIHFYGKPGSGKSKLVEILAQHLHRIKNNVANGTPLSPMACTYPVNLDDQFFGGYNGQTVLEYNDPCQNMDKERLMFFLNQLISFGQDSPAKLNMADLESKLGTYMTSPFIMITSNGPMDSVLNHVTGLLQDKKAIERRIHYEIEVELAEDAKDHDPTFYDWKFVVKRRPKFSKVPIDDLLGYKQLVDLCWGGHQYLTGAADSFKKLHDLPDFIMSDPAYKTQARFQPDKESRRAHVVYSPYIGTFYGRCLVYLEETFKMIFEVEYYREDKKKFEEAVLRYSREVSQDPDSCGFYVLPKTSQGDYDYESLHAGSSSTWTIIHIKSWGKAAMMCDNIKAVFQDESFGMTAQSFRDPLNWLPCDKDKVDIRTHIVSGSKFPLFLTKWLGHSLADDISDVAGAIVSVVAFIIGYITAMIALLRLMSFFYAADKKPDDLVSSLPDATSVTQVNYPKNVAAHPLNVKLRSPIIQPVTQGGSSNVIFKNIRAIAWVTKDKVVHGGNLYALGLTKTFMLLPLHFFHSIHDDVQYLRVTDLEKLENQFFDVSDVIDNAVQIDVDLAVVKLKNGPQFRDIVQHFHTAETIAQMTTENGVLLHNEVVAINKTIRHHYAGKLAISHNVTYVGVSEVEKYTLSKYFSFAYPTEEGMCGNVYQVERPGMSSTICGMHVGGNSYSGIGIIVSRDDIVYALESFGTFSIQSATASDIFECESFEGSPCVKLPSRAKLIKILPPNLSVFMPNKHDFEINYDFQDLFTGHADYPAEERDRALLKPTMIGDSLINPVQVAISKIGDEIFYPSDKDLSVFKEVAEAYSQQWPIGHSWQIFDETAVLNGCGDYFKAMNMNKSAGIVDEKLMTTGKYSLIYCGTCSAQRKCTCAIKNWKITDSARNDIDSVRASLSRGERPKFFFMDVLKSELRKKTRVLQGQSRLFSVGSFSMLYLGRECFGPFMKAFNENPFLFCSGIGLNPHSLSWGRLLNVLNANPYAVFADAKNWDANMVHQLCMIIHDHINLWFARTRDHYGALGYDIGSQSLFDNQQKIRKYYAHYIYRVWHVVNNVVYEVDGNPSGQPLTGIINTLYNNVCTVAAYHLYCLEDLNSKQSVFQSNAAIRRSCTGDDVVFTHSSIGYTCQKHASFISRFGIKLTPADKSDKFTVDHYALKDGDYLKRSFVQNETGLVLAPLDPLSVYGACNWKSRGMSSQAAALAYFPCFQVELFHYGKDIFERDSKIFAQKYSDLYGSVLPYKSHEQIKEDFVSGRLNLEFHTQSGNLYKQEDRIKAMKSKRAPGLLNRPSEKGFRSLLKNVAWSKEGVSAKVATAPKWELTAKELTVLVRPNANHKQQKMIVDRDEHGNEILKKNPGLRVGKPRAPTQDVELPRFHKIVEDKLYVFNDADSLLTTEHVGPRHVPKVYKRAPLPAKSSAKSEYLSFVSDRQIADDTYGEKKINVFLKTSDIKVAKNKPATVKSKMSANAPTFEFKRPKPLEEIIDVPVFEDPKEDFELAPVVQDDPKLSEITTSVTISDPPSDGTEESVLLPNMPSISKNNTFKRGITQNFRPPSSNMKRAYRPRGDNANTTALLRALNLFDLNELKTKYNIIHVRDANIFAKTSFHYARNNLFAWAKRNNASITTNEIKDPNYRLPIMQVTVVRNGKAFVAAGVDIDTKNAWKFAFYNSIVNLSCLGENIEPFFIQSVNGEKLLVSAPTESITEQIRVEQDRPIVDADTSIRQLLQKDLDPYEDQTPQQLLGRKRLLETFTFSSSTAIRTQLNVQKLPLDIITHTYYTNLLNRFSMCMFDVEFEIMPSTNMMQAGAIMWQFFPSYDQSTSTSPFVYDANCDNGPLMVIQDVASGDVAKITIPGMTFKSGFSTVPVSSYESAVTGTLRAVILSPLSEPGTTGVVSVTYSVYVTLKNIRCYSFKTQSAYQTTSDFVAHLPDLPKKENEAKSKSRIISTSLDTLSKISSAVAIIPQYRPVASSVAVLSKLAAKVARYWGYSMGTSVTAVEPAVIRPLFPSTNHHGLRHADIHALAVDSKTATSVQVDPSLVDYNLFDNYKLLPTWMYQFDIASTDAIGMKFKYKVGPQYTRGYGSSVLYVNSSPSSTLAKGHCFWHGGMKYTFSVHCNRFTVLRLRVFWKPRNDPGLPTSLEANDYVGLIVDINGPTTFSFSVPYLSEHPMLSTAVHDTDDTDDSTNNGIICVELLNKVQVQTSEVQFVWINVFGSCGETMLFSRPVGLLTVIPEAPDAIEKEFVAQSKGETINDLVAHFRTTFPPLAPASEVVLDRITVPDYTCSWTERFSKPTYYKALTVTPSTTLGSSATFLDLNELFVETTPSPFQALFQNFAVLRGSINVDLVPLSGTAIGSSNHQVFATAVYGNDINDPDVFSMSGTAYSDGLARQTLSMSFPMYGHTIYRSVGMRNSYLNSKYGCSVEVLSATATAVPMVFAVLISLGDDFMLSVPRPTVPYAP